MVNPEIPKAHHSTIEQVVDNAIVEYFADIIFDERIDHLIEKSDYSNLSFSTKASSTSSIYPAVFGANHYTPYIDQDGDTEKLEPSTILRASGSISSFHGVSHTHIEFVSHTDSSRRLVFNAQDSNPFVVTHTLSKDKDFMSPYLAAELFAIAHNDNPTPLLRGVSDTKEDYATVHDIIKKYWENYATEIEGKKTSQYLLERPALKSTDEYPVYHRFLYTKDEISSDEETHKSGYSAVTLVYEKVFKIPELDSETILRLSITLLDRSSEPINEACKIVRTTGQPGIESLSASYITSEGVTQELDLSDSDVKKYFVDSFDELLSLA